MARAAATATASKLDDTGGMHEGNADVALRQHLDENLEALREYRQSWLSHWAELAKFILPRRYHWLITANKTNRGDAINGDIIDSTATVAMRVLASGLMSGITSPTRQWFKLGLSNPDLNDKPTVKAWLDECQRRLYLVMAESNFYTAMAVLFQDLATFGTAPEIIYEDYEDVIRCFNPCAGEYFLQASDRFEANGLYREFTMTAQQVTGMFGLENCSPTIQSLAFRAGAGMQTEIIVCHAIEPNLPFGPDNVMLGEVPKRFAWREVYWEKGAGQMFRLRARGFHECPFIAPRWDVVSNDAYGRSPAMDALGDTKQLQLETKRKAQAIDKLVTPPMVAPVSLKNQPASLLPGGVTYVADPTGASFKPAYEINPRLAELQQDIAEVQKRIQTVFFNDLFLMISQLDTVRTATEIDARREEKLIQLGPVLERFQNEALNPVIGRIFNIMKRAGLIPPAPPEMKGAFLSIEYVSILAQAQRAVETSAIERLLQVVGNIAAADPQALDNLDYDETIREYGDLLGTPPKLVRSSADVMKLRAQRAKQQQQQQQMQQSLAAVQGAQTLSKTDLGGGQNALGMLMGNQAGNA